MATSPESGLNPARGDDGGAVLCALEFVAGGDVEFVEVCRTEVGQRMTLEPSPQEFDGVQVRRVRRQVLSEAVKKGGTYVARAMKRDACRSTENSARLDRRSSRFRRAARTCTRPWAPARLQRICWPLHMRRPTMRLIDDST